MEMRVEHMSKETTVATPITAAERRKRQEAADFARASVGLEAGALKLSCDGDSFTTWPASLCHQFRP